MNIAKEIQLGLEIITKVKPSTYFSAEHNKIWCCQVYYPDDHIESQNMPDKVWAFDDNEPVVMYFQQVQIERLYELGWFIDTDIGAWSHFCKE